MLKIEQNYDFRERLCKPHKRIYRIKGDTKKAGELEIKNGDLLFCSEQGEVAVTAAKDFADYMKTAFNIKLIFTDNEDTAKIRLSVNKEGLSEDSSGYMGRRVSVDKDKITIIGYDETEGERLFVLYPEGDDK
jgi:hypothetical protein